MDPGNLLLRLRKRHCGRAEPHAARQILGDTTLCSDHAAIRDFEVTDDAHLSSHHDACANARAPGDTSLRHDHGIFSDHDIVRDLHEIIDFHALLYPCPT